MQMERLEKETERKAWRLRDYGDKGERKVSFEFRRKPFEGKSRQAAEECHAGSSTGLTPFRTLTLQFPC